MDRREKLKRVLTERVYGMDLMMDSDLENAVQLIEEVFEPKVTAEQICAWAEATSAKGACF